MTTYYVRKTGSDAAAGTSAGAAWLTVDKAANTVAAGDIIWIGAGVYRETVTIDTSGTNGSEIEWRADIDGAMTGDPGLVILTVLSDEVGTGGTGTTLNLNGKTFNEFHDIVFGPGGSNSLDRTVLSTVTTTFEGVLFDTCTFYPPADFGNDTLYLQFVNGGSISGNKPAFQNCIIHGNMWIDYATFSADAACGWQFVNCGIIGKLTIDGPTSASFGPTGYSITNNKIENPNGVCIQVGDQWGTGTIGRIDNNIIVSNNSSPISLLGDAGTWGGINNRCIGDSFTALADASNIDICGFLFGSDVDHIYRKWFGWSPYGAHEQVYDSNGGGYKSGGVDAGSATYAPATDIYGNARPMGTADDIGPAENNPRGARSATWAADGSTYSMAFDSTGFYESRLPVNAVSTTISVKAYKDAAYAGTAPMIEVFIGKVSQGAVSMTVGNEVEETLSVNFTPSEAGWARARLHGYATAGAVYYDSLAVT